MLRLILAFVDIMLHRRGPEDLPSSRFLLYSLIATSLGLGLLVAVWSDQPGRVAAVGALVAVLDLWFVWALLRTFGRERRFRQTMTAMLGAEVVLSVLHAPVVPFLLDVPDTDQPTVTLPMLLTTLVFFWQIDISAYVFSRALERPYMLCLAIVIAYTLLMISLQTTLVQPVR